MESETIWAEVRLLLKRIPIVKTLLITLLALVALVVAAIYFPFEGKTWYETLFILAWIALLLHRHRTPQGASSKTKSKNLSGLPTVHKIITFLRRHRHFIRSIFSVVLGVVITAGSMWLLLTLIRWFWLHPLFR
jgi:hypothetical protein